MRQRKPSTRIARFAFEHARRHQPRWHRREQREAHQPDRRSRHQDVAGSSIDRWRGAEEQPAKDSNSRDEVQRAVVDVHADDDRPQVVDERVLQRALEVQMQPLLEMQQVVAVTARDSALMCCATTMPVPDPGVDDVERHR